MDSKNVYVVKVFGNRPEPRNKGGRQGYRINVGVASTLDGAKKIGEDYFKNNPEVKKLLEQDDKFEDVYERTNDAVPAVYKKHYGCNRDKLRTPEAWYMAYEVEKFELQP